LLADHRINLGRQLEAVQYSHAGNASQEVTDYEQIVTDTTGTHRIVNAIRPLVCRMLAKNTQ